MKVAIPYYYELHSQLKEMYPEVEWIQVDNASAAFHKVKEGELDATGRDTAKFALHDRPLLS